MMGGGADLLRDIYAIVRHEWRGFFRYGESRRTGWIRWSAVVFLSIIIARALGPEFGMAWTTIPAVTFIAIIFIPAVVADSIAGERERHTLETMLASRISDKALLFGKYIANLAYGWSASFLMLILGVGAAHLRYGGTGFYQINPTILGAALIVSLLGAGAITGVGILVSLRAATVRRAVESLALIMLALTLGPALLAELPLPTWIEGLLEELPPLPPEGPGSREFLILTTGLVMVNGVVLAIALARFKRSRLLA